MGNRNAPTPSQEQALRQDCLAHRKWLESNRLKEHPYKMTENPFTGLVLAGLLDPDSAAHVCRALLAGLDPSLTADALTVTTAYWPSRGVDLVIEIERRDRHELVVMEHKRFASPSHAPGYKKNGAALWQTDQVYQASTSGYWPLWMHETDPDLPVRFVVLDGYGKPMNQMFPDGLHNTEWSVTSYRQFAGVLRAEHDTGTRGLVPLLTAVYAGCAA